MRQQSLILVSTLLLGILLALTGCEQESIKDHLDSTYQIENKAAEEDKTAQYVYFDEAGNLENLQVNGTLVTVKKEGREQTFDISEAVLRTEQTSLSRSITQITGSLSNDFRGRLNISYVNGQGRVAWQMRDDLTFWGEIECVNQVRDQLIAQIRITRSTAGDPFDVGQRVVTTLRDHGTPDAEQGIYDQIAKVMLIYARADECMNRFLPSVNDLIGYDNSKGNIVTR